jgi:ubiquinol-cytochrome c reductase cytochrome c subunit
MTVVVAPARSQSGTGRGEQGTEPAGAGVGTGSFLYLRDCGVCHGEQGQGTPRGQSLKDISPAEVDYALSTGRMPIDRPGAERRRRDPKYSDAERKAIVDHMRSFIARQPDIPEVHPEEGDIAEGAELYFAQCAACHQWAGEGGALLGDIESPALGPVTPLQVAEAIRAGPLNMPAFVLSDEEVNSIAAYVEYLKRPEDRGGAQLWHFGPLPEGAIAWIFGLGVVVLLCRWIGTRE